MLVTDINKKQLALSVAIPLLVGGLATAINFSGFSEFQSLNQPALTPPPWVFSVVWTILYALMGISAARIWLSPPTKERNHGLIIWGAQLFFNFFWSLIFFNLQAYGFAFIWILILWALIIAMIYIFNKTDRLAAILQIPYLIWVTFAAYLNFMVWMLNR